MHDTTETRRQAAARAIRTSLVDDPGGEVGEFVRHHLDELPSDFWLQHLGSPTPDSLAVVESLQLRSSWGERDAEHFDFTLPGGVTQYVVCVRFDSNGEIDRISMES